METINALEIAYSLSVFGIEAEIEAEATCTQDQVDAAIAALDALESKVVTGAQLGAAIAMLNTLPAKPVEPEGGRQAQPERAAAIIPEYRVRAALIRGCSIE